MNSETAAMKPNHALRAGSVITHRNLNGEDREYTVEKVLGQPGGFGITYLASFLATNEVSGNMGSFDSTAEVNVAIKEFFMNGCGRNPDGSVNVGTVDPAMYQKFKNRFNEEAKILSQFSNLRYLVSVVDFFEAHGTAYMVMEYITGSDLDHMVTPNKPLDEATAIKYIMQVAFDLFNVHDKGIVHRDIKPSNLMIHHFRDPKTKEKQQIATLIDFGAAKDYSGDSEISDYSIYTEAYAAPEQINPWGDKGRFTDVYSLCGLLYYMIEGQRPPVVTTRKASDPPLQMNRASPEIARIIDKGMSFKAEDRYQDCLELNMALSNEKKWSDLYDREVFYEKPTEEGRRPTIVVENPPVDPGYGSGLDEEDFENNVKKDYSKAVIVVVAVVLLAVAGIFYWRGDVNKDDPQEESSDTTVDAAQLTMNPASGMENGGEIQVPVTLAQPVAEGFTVDVKPSGGTATEGKDYTLVTPQLTFSGVENETQNIIIRPIDDRDVEPNEVLTVGLANLRDTEASVNLGQQVTVTIENDDASVGAIPRDNERSSGSDQNQPDKEESDSEQKGRLIAMSMDDYLGKLIDENFSYSRREDLMIREMRLYFPEGSAISTYANMSDAQLAEDYLKEFISKARLIKQLRLIETKQAKSGIQVFILEDSRHSEN